VTADRVIRKILASARGHAFKNEARGLLLELCRIDTTQKRNPAKMRKAESACFDILERELKILDFLFSLERRAINPAIQNHRHFSSLQGRAVDKVYEGRSNLLCFIPGAKARAKGSSVALNAHIDVVAPFIPPRADGDVVYGRGACDDKGPVVSMIMALKILSHVMKETGLRWNKNVLAMFVIDEETGGNGSLSLAMDRNLKKFYDSILVGECTGLKLYPANRGAVWYRAELTQPAFETSAYVIEELEKEGRAIRAESRHPLFPSRPVQTCHGMIGTFGEHPSRICGATSFTIRFRRRPAKETEPLVRDCIESGLHEYVGLYGDKMKILDESTGKPIVKRHYDLRRDGNGFRIDVHGASGHMGALAQRDGAITKMAHFVRALAASRSKLESLNGEMEMELRNADKDGPLILEGGQGFLPTHDISEIMERLRKAAQRAAGANVKMTYEKLHNVAFDGDPGSRAMLNALAAAKRCQAPQNKPLIGWTASCDARLFATEYSGMNVLTFGPGKLAHAHADNEQISLTEIRRASEILALFLLKQTGTLNFA